MPLIIINYQLMDPTACNTIINSESQLLLNNKDCKEMVTNGYITYLHNKNGQIET